MCLFFCSVVLVMRIYSKQLEGWGSWNLNGWGVWRIIPFVFLAPLLSSVGARYFDKWINPSRHHEAQLTNRLVWLVVGVVLFGCIVYIQNVYAFEDLQQQDLIRPEPISLFAASSLLFLVGLLHLIWEFQVQKAADGFPFYERRTAALATARWRRPQQDHNDGLAVEGSYNNYADDYTCEVAVKPVIGGDGTKWTCVKCSVSCLLCLVLRQELVDVIKMALFWICVFGVKMLFACLLLVPTLLSSHSDLMLAFPLDKLDDEVPQYQSQPWLLWLQPASLTTLCMVLFLWSCGAMIFLAGCSRRSCACRAVAPHLSAP